MADLTPQERLQPSLLDRLTDTDPESKSESRERRVLSVQRLRAGVLRDLGWLLNTGHYEATESLEHYPYVRESVLNYGMPEISGATLGSVDAKVLEKSVRDAIARFEPRLNSKSLKVTVNVDTDQMSSTSVTLTIHGELWAKPTPIALYLKTDVDLETRSVEVTER